jgi:hypothetical protein
MKLSFVDSCSSRKRITIQNSDGESLSCVAHGEQNNYWAQQILFKKYIDEKKNKKF